MRVPRVPGSKVTVISRRQLIAGASAAGGVLLSSTWPAFAQDDDDEGNHASCDLRLCPSPNAIPHVNKKTAGFGTFHFYFPGPVEGTTAATDGEPGGTEPGGRDPATIYNFKGFIGQVDLSLTGTGTDLNTQKNAPYSFHTDSRFATGIFKGADGLNHHGTFAVVWLDSIVGSGSPLGPHSYDLGVSRTGLFWTTPVEEGDVRVDFDDGEAVLRLRNICALDAFTVANSLSSGSMLGHPVAAVINSLTIRWSGIKRTVVGFQSTSPPADERFAGDFIETSATIEVDVTTLASTGHGFHFVSDPANTTVTNFAQIGRERNGVFA